MPAHLKALMVVMVLAVVVLTLARRYATASAIAPADYTRRALVWLTLTVLAFVTHNYFVFVILTAPLLYFAARRDSNPLAFCFFVLFAIPPFPFQVPLVGGLQNLIMLDHLRWLSIAVLLPALLALWNKRGVTPLGATAIDKAILGYVALWVVLVSFGATLTITVRFTVGLFLDILLPYAIASRALRDIPAYRDALMSFVVAALLLSLTSVFEFTRSWLLYEGLEQVLRLPTWGFGNFVVREGGFMRAIATAGHPIALGYLLLVAMAMLIFLKSSIRHRRVWWLAWCTLGAGLLAAFSRGPWVGAAAMVVVLIITGEQVRSNLIRAGAAGLVLVPVALMTSKGQALISYLPWIGTADTQNVDFRERLFEVGLAVVMQSPFFGPGGGEGHPDMEQMRGGDGIIDVVNTYLGVALSTGFVGLALFVAPFLFVTIGIALQLHRMKAKGSDEHRLGRALLAAMVGILVTIATVAPICAVAVTYVFVTGLGAGYLSMLKSFEFARSSQLVPKAGYSAFASGRPRTARDQF